MLLIKNGKIKTMAGVDYENASLFIDDDGKIAAIGENLEIPEGAEVIDAEGRLVTPGCIEAHCRIGLEGTAIGWEGEDYNETSSPLTPQLRAIDGINPYDEAFEDARRGGITTACIGPACSNVIAGSFAAIKLYGRRIDDMILRTPIAMGASFGNLTKQAQAKNAASTRMGLAFLIREIFYKTKNYLTAKEEGKNPAFDMKLEALIPVIKGEIPLRARAHRADDILTAIRIAKEFGIRLTLDFCTDGARIKEKIAATGFPVVVGPDFPTKSRGELMSRSFATAGELYGAGSLVSITTNAGDTPIKHLPLCAGLASREGLPLEEAWRAITINPATAMGISDRVGSLEVGKDGDVVIWTDDPLTTVSGTAYVTVIDGKVVFRR